MADPLPQNYANHAHRPIAWNVVWLICFVALVASIWTAVRDRTLIAHVVLVMAIGLVGTVSVLRVYLLRVQDRVIRLEMRIRMAALGLASEFDHLAHRQVIALRFASDAEMTELARRAIAEKLPPDQIKRAIVNWQGDFFRT
jgi:hypothetical protein